MSAKEKQHRGRGRPRSTDDLTLTVTIRLTRAELAALKRLSQADDRSMSRWVGMAIRRAAAPVAAAGA